MHNYRKQDQLFHMVMHLPVALAAVSPAVNDILAGQFRRSPLTVPNGVDCGRFAPGRRAALQPTATVAYPGGQVVSSPAVWRRFSHGCQLCGGSVKHSLHAKLLETACCREGEDN